MNNKIYEKPTIQLSRFKWVYILIGLVLLYYIFQLSDFEWRSLPCSGRG